MNSTIVAVDLAKSVFQLAVADSKKSNCYLRMLLTQGARRVLPAACNLWRISDADFCVGTG